MDGARLWLCVYPTTVYIPPAGWLQSCARYTYKLKCKACVRFYVFLKINFLKTTYISTKVSSASSPPAYAPPPPAAVSVFRLNLSISPRRATVEVVDDTIYIVKRTRIPRGDQTFKRKKIPSSGGDNQEFSKQKGRGRPAAKNKEALPRKGNAGVNWEEMANMHRNM